MKALKERIHEYFKKSYDARKTKIHYLDYLIKKAEQVIVKHETGLQVDLAARCMETRLSQQKKIQKLMDDKAKIVRKMKIDTKWYEFQKKPEWVIVKTKEYIHDFFYECKNTGTKG